MGDLRSSARCADAALSLAHGINPSGRLVAFPLGVYCLSGPLVTGPPGGLRPNKFGTVFDLRVEDRERLRSEILSISNGVRDRLSKGPLVSSLYARQCRNGTTPGHHRWPAVPATYRDLPTSRSSAQRLTPTAQAPPKRPEPPSKSRSAQGRGNAISLRSPPSFLGLVRNASKRHKEALGRPLVRLRVSPYRPRLE